MSFLERYSAAIVRHAWAVMGLVALLTVLLLFALRGLHTDFSAEGSLPAGNRYVRIDHRIRAEFGGRNTVIIAIVPRDRRDVWRPEVLEVVAELTRAALRLPEVIPHNIVSLASPNVRHVEERGGLIAADYLMREVPRTAAEIARLRRWVEEDPQLRGFLVTPDQRAAILIVDFWEGIPGPEIVANIKKMLAPYRDRPLDFHLAGEPLWAVSDLRQSAEIARRIPWTFAVIAVMLLASFRSLQGMVVPMMTAFLATLWGLGLMAATGIGVDAWNVATPILVIAVAAGHSAQMLKRYYEEFDELGDNRAAVVASTTKIGPVMLAAGATAALGFASLALFGVRSIANFGLAAAYGIASAVFLEMTFIPALRSRLRAPRGRTERGVVVGRFLRLLEAALFWRRGIVVSVVALAAVLLAGVGMLWIRTYGSTREYLPRNSVFRRDIEAIERHFPGTVTMTILYAGPRGSMKDVRVLHHMARLQARIERNPLVWRTASLADLVKQLHRVFDPQARNPYSLPDDQKLVSQLLFLGQSSAFERFVNRAESEALVIAYLRDDDSALVGPLVHDLEAWVEQNPPGAKGVEVEVAGGVGPTILAVNEHTTWGKVLNIVVVLIAIFGVSSVVLRTAVGGVYVATPIAITMVLLFGLLGWTGVKLDMASASVLAIAAGIGADYAIYFLYRLREEYRVLGDLRAAVARALDTSGRAVIFVAVSIAAGFSVEATSDYLGLRLLGTLTPASMVIACLSALSVIPLLVVRTRPSFIFAPAQAATAGFRESRLGAAPVGDEGAVAAGECGPVRERRRVGRRGRGR